MLLKACRDSRRIDFQLLGEGVTTTDYGKHRIGKHTRRFVMKTLFAVTLLVLALDSTTAIAATFDGNQCLGDCSGHQAGYNWAEQNDVDDESSCSTPSASFNEGCQSYIDENSESSSGTTSLNDDDDDDEEEDE